MQPKNPLAQYAKNYKSKNGEDGIIERIVQLIGEGSRWYTAFRNRNRITR